VPLKLAAVDLLLFVLMLFALAALALLANAAALAGTAVVIVLPLLRGRRSVLRGCAALLAAVALGCPGTLAGLSRLFLRFLLALRVLLHARAAALNVWLAVAAVVLLGAAGVLTSPRGLLSARGGVLLFGPFLDRFCWHLVSPYLFFTNVLPLTIPWQ
jgi:hypothetical protein